jgi:hypothetical protein
MGSSRTPGPQDQEGNPFRFLSNQSPGTNGLNDRFDLNLLSKYLEMPVWARPTDASRQWPFCPAEPRGPAGTIPLSGFQDLIADMNKACAVPVKSAPPAPPKENLGPLEVPEGQVTFDAEGNDNPKSPYFSRVIIWPGNAESGVTLGRGYDMGNRTEAAITADLIKAGLTPDKAKAFAKGAGKKGQDAYKFVKDNRATLGEITHEQQKALFNLIYPKYVKRAHEIYDLKTVDKIGKDLPGKVAWDKLDPPIRDILVDFVYQGFSGSKPMQHGMTNDYDTLIDYIEGTAAIAQYEGGRHRADYLRKRKPRKMKK